MAHPAYYELAQGEVEDKISLKDYLEIMHGKKHGSMHNESVVFDTHILRGITSQEWLSLQQTFPQASPIRVLSVGGYGRSGFGLHAHG